MTNVFRKTIVEALFNLLRRCDDIDLVMLTNEIYTIMRKNGQQTERRDVAEALIDKIDFINGEMGGIVEKPHCAECKHFFTPKFNKLFSISEENCYHSKNRGTWRSGEALREKPWVLNKKMDCKWFEPKPDEHETAQHPQQKEVTMDNIDELYKN